MTGAPLYAPNAGIGVMNVIGLFSVNGSTGGNVGISTWQFLVKPTD